MLAFLGACFARAMWLGPVQHQDPLRVAVPFPLLQGPAFVLIPVVSRLLHRAAPTWLLTSGFVLMAVGCLLCTRLDVTDPDLTALVVPALLIGVGFALCVSSVTAVALDSVPPRLAGMASATTNMLRDLGFALGPVVVTAVALSNAGTAFTSKLNVADLPAEQLGAARAIAAEGGPIAVNSLPPGVPGSAAHDLTLDALGSGFSTAFLICGIAGRPGRGPYRRRRDRASALTAPPLSPRPSPPPPSGAARRKPRRSNKPGEEEENAIHRYRAAPGGGAGAPSAGAARSPAPVVREPPREPQP
ncbi:MFS transporter, partial [Streptomyces sp. NPDC058690]|uniref:MFS transporter n=1 Tax=Streptomyces sp. NPDC058690 TaxID=3346600 RepID=UPI003651D7EA